MLTRIDLVFTLRLQDFVEGEFPQGHRHPQVCESPAFEYAVSYTGEELRTDGGRRVHFYLSRHYDILFSYYKIDSGLEPVKDRYPILAGLAHMRLELRITVGNEVVRAGSRDGPGHLIQP